MTAFRLGAASADIVQPSAIQSFLDAEAQGQANSAKTVALVDTPRSNGYPGFSAIFDKVWGVAQQIINPQNTNMASTLPKDTSGSDLLSAALPIATVGVAGFLAYLVFSKKPRRKRSRST